MAMIYDYFYYLLLLYDYYSLVIIVTIYINYNALHDAQHTHFKEINFCKHIFS